MRSSTPAPNDVCAICKKTFSTHSQHGRPDWDYYCGDEISYRTEANVFTPSPAPEVAATSDKKIIDAMIAGQFGQPDQVDAIEKHMAEYFTRWPNYKEKFNHLEWYHIFLDFMDSLPRVSGVAAPTGGSEDIRVMSRIQLIDELHKSNEAFKMMLEVKDKAEGELAALKALLVDVMLIAGHHVGQSLQERAATLLEGEKTDH